MNIADKNGIWLKNEGQFAIVDPISNTRFEPGEAVKATHTKWAKDQPTIKRCGDPTSELSEKEQAKLDQQNAADEAARADALAAAEAAQAAARGEGAVAALDQINAGDASGEVQA
jgi:hypothetical protein